MGSRFQRENYRISDKKEFNRQWIKEKKALSELTLGQYNTL